ncbi:MAG: transketolase [Pirellulales bacterium]|nr:transketolase [Pirellulales bacterium]
MSTATTDLQQLAINTIRTLSMDAVQQANSGHPGTPMALAPAAYVLWNEILRYDPAQPLWPGRDRFILSCGHASMLLYATLHLAGVKQCDGQGNVTSEDAVTLDQIKNFRQLGSRTPGHPEYHDTTGVETTTGPLGQGLGNSVGMAMASRWQAAHFGQGDFRELFDFNVYALCSDGDIMEGVACEAASLAGHLKLSNLCWIYDDNKITIEGSTSLAFSEDVEKRFRGLGWHVADIDDANDLQAIRDAISKFHACQDAPTLIVLRSHIGFGAPNKQDTAAAHGSPLGEDEIHGAKQNYGWDPDAQFHVPEDVLADFRTGIGARGAELYAAWQEGFAAYRSQHPQLATAWETMQTGELPSGWDGQLPAFETTVKGPATRASSGKVLNTVSDTVPWLIGGSADLAGSNNTLIDGETDFDAGNYLGRNLHFGIREHAMGAAQNGMALCKLRPYGGTFLVFSDYMRPSIRLASLMKQPALYVFTHDSIGLGEDGPTHQPVEHLAALRAIPNLHVVRPADANEVAAAYRKIMPRTDGPSALILTRQSVPTYDRTKYAAAENVAKGAYVLADAENPRAILIGSGSEVALCMEAYESLQAEGIGVRVVSMPCWEWFAAEPETYRNQVLPPSVTHRVGVEAATGLGWERFLGSNGTFIGMSEFGISAPFQQAYKHFGITVERIVAAVKERN